MEIALQAALTFWDKISKEEKQQVLKNTSIKTYKKGENVHSADNDCIGVLVVKSGELRTYIISEDGREVTLYRLNQGEVCILSASCLIKSINFDVYIDAEQDTEILLINASTFAQLQKSNVYIENFALKSAVDKFSDVMWALEQLLFKSIDKRLAALLLDEVNKTKSLEIEYTHEQIAKYLGSAREVISRKLKTFQDYGIVSLHRGGLTVTSKEKLKNMI